jgi:hypothetical protein
MGLHQEVKFGPAVCLHAPVSAAAHARKEGEEREKGKKKRKGKRRLGKNFKPEIFLGRKIKDNLLDWSKIYFRKRKKYIKL